MTQWYKQSLSKWQIGILNHFQPQMRVLGTSQTGTKMNGINKQPLYIKGDFALIARYNKFDDCVEIADINQPQEGWTDYDPTQGASSDELTEICNSLHDRCLLAELGVEGFTPANMQYLVKQPLTKI